MKKPVSNWVKVLVNIAVALIIFAAMFYFINFNEFKKQLFKIPWTTFVIITLAYYISWMLRGYRWKLLVATSGSKISLGDSFSLAVIGNMSNIFLPAKLGDIIWINAAHEKSGLGYSQAFVTIFISRLFDLFTILILGILSLPFFLGQNIQVNIYIPIGISLFLLISLYLVFEFGIKRGWLKRLLIGPFSKFQGLFDKLRNHSMKIIQNFRVLATAVLISLVVWFIEVFICFILLPEKGYILFMLAIVAANLLKTVPITPGGIGPYEGVVAFILVSQGVSKDTALSIGIINHFMLNFLTILFAAFAIIKEGASIFRFNFRLIKEKLNE